MVKPPFSIAVKGQAGTNGKKAATGNDCKARDASLMAANVIQHRFDDMRLYTNISYTRARRPLFAPGCRVR